MTTQNLRGQFLLDPDVVFLNHGSFGACPAPVFEDYQRWQRELERQPVEFLGRRADPLLNDARAKVGAFLNADADDLVFVPNATIGVNTIARSIKLQPGDEILTTDHEYGACDNTWEFVCHKTGARYIHQPIPLPITALDDVVEAFWAAVTPRTRVIYMSHITSPTALILPIEEICRRARAAGILTVIDGAHVPGQIPLDIKALDADFYTGNFHKWLCSPKGSAFLYARRDQHAHIDPLVVSWGWSRDTSFVTRNQWQGTRDIAAFLTVPKAIEFFEAHHWDVVRARCHELAVQTRKQLSEMTGLPFVAPESCFSQMFVARLPAVDVNALKSRLYDEYRVEVPIIQWNNQYFVRVSVQAYNTPDDMEQLMSALSELLPAVAV